MSRNPQNLPAAGAAAHSFSRRYRPYREGGGGQGEAGAASGAGAAGAMAVGAARCAAVAGFGAGLGFGLVCATGAPRRAGGLAGINSTNTGLGTSRGGAASPSVPTSVEVAIRTGTVCG